ncbi:MAG: Sugar diacid utilization regulator SdaR [uncultured Thermomicrobiales bacterium]|uniref:Sugar diacid utilization regulator SdaR n=1 Tax=uncultured Thermomicrobiales bacterium TaxID=1645740 RepID=A0A6J4V5X6_9BACT|nr:MAG: Sugar diacid utilization regulator SdaR [uncultured Thermomicrobiales bacterium]
MDYQQITTTLARQAAELLQTAVAVTDEQDRIVAGSDARTIGLPSRLAGAPLDPAYLRVPLRLDTRAGEVIVARPQHDEGLSPRLAQIIVDLVISQTISINRPPSRHALKNAFVRELLQGLIADEATILRQAKLLELDLVPPRAVILIDAAGFILTPEGVEDGRRTQLLINSIVSFFTLPNDTICAYLGDGEVAVLKASNTRNLATWAANGLRQEGGTSSWADLGALRRASEALLARLRLDTGAAVSIGIGRHHPGLGGLAHSYQDARAALSLGRCIQGPNGVHGLDRLGVAAFVGLGDEATKVELAQHLLSPLDHEPELLDTLDAFFAENCCPSTAARRLAIHRNTLGYRLDKIASLSGLDPRRFDEALQIRLALVLRALHARDNT